MLKLAKSPDCKTMNKGDKKTTGPHNF